MTKDDVKSAVKEALDDCSVDPKTHVAHHTKLGLILNVTDKMSTTLVGLFVLAMAFAFGFFIYKIFHIGKGFNI